MAYVRRNLGPLAVALLAALISPVSEAGAAPTYLDPTFGADGAAMFGPSGSRALAMALAPDGKIIVGGAQRIVESDDEQVATVTRLLPDGTLDPTFGSFGVFTLGGGDISSQVISMALQPDGRILAAVEVEVVDPIGGNRAVDVIRLDSTGHLDPTFGAGGRLSRPPGLNARALFSSVALQPDGKILVTDAIHKAYPSHEFDMVVARYNLDGTADAGFGEGGVAMADFSTATEIRNDFASAVAVLPGGRIVIGGWSDVSFGSSDRFALAAFTAQGAPDASFGTDGKVLTAIPHGSASGSYLHRLAVQGDGKLVAVGAVNTVNTDWYGSASKFAFARYSANGVLDPTFGTNGTTVVDIPPAAADSAPNSLAIDSAGRIVAAGGRTSPRGDDFAVVRLLANGMPDPSFGGSGFVLTALTAPAQGAYAMTVAPNGRIFAAGKSDDRATVVRYRLTSGVSAWGWNPVGQLGNGSVTDSHVPTAVTPLFGADRVAAGAYHGLAVKGDRRLWAWGWNGAGQLGDGTTIDRWSPVSVPGLDGVLSFAAGAYHSLAVVEDGSAWAWGWNALGQLGDGTTADRHDPVPVAMPRFTSFVGVAAGALHSLAVDSEGRVWAWGWNGAGQLGDGTTTDRFEPTIVPALTGVVAVAAGAYHSLALKADGTVWAWGWNGAGQLGDGTTLDRHQPVPLPGLTGVRALSAGGYHSLAVRSDGTAAAWGWNIVGQLGDGTTVDRHEPHTVPGLTGVVAVAGGAFHSVGLAADGSVRAWGWNGVGQLGDGTTIDRHVPVPVAGVTGATATAAGLAQSVTVRP